jgi:hypothetical protein
VIDTTSVPATSAFPNDGRDADAPIVGAHDFQRTFKDLDAPASAGYATCDAARGLMVAAVETGALCAGNGTAITIVARVSTSCQVVKSVCSPSGSMAEKG